MKIGVVSGLGVVWGSYSPDVLDREDRGTVGGGEAAMLQTAFGLAARGHDVNLYYPGVETVYRGVKFQPLGSQAREIASRKFEAVVSWSDHNILMAAPQGVKRIYSQQLNDLPFSRKFWEHVDVIVAASPNHAEFLKGFQPIGIGDVKWSALYFGLQPANYLAQKPLAERAPIVSYWSSPDRGLHHLLLVWPLILDAVPDAQLRIFYHLDRFRDGVRGSWRAVEVVWRAAILDAMIAKRMPGVQIMGPQPRLVLARHQMETKVWAMPFDPVCYTEGACVSAGEALAAGCYAVARPDDALPSVYGNAIRWVPAPICDDDFRRRFAQAVIEGLLADTAPNPEARAEVVSTYTWERSTTALEKAILS